MSRSGARFAPKVNVSPVGPVLIAPARRRRVDPTRSTTMTRPPKAATAALVLAALAGCSSGPNHNSASASTASSAGAMSGMAEAAPAAPAAAAAPAPAAAAAAAPAAKAAPTSGSSAKRSARAAPQSAAGQSAAGRSAAAGSDLGIPTSALAGRNIAYNAEETLQVDDVGKAVSSVEAAAAAAGGLVADSERSGLGDDATANLVLKVPPAGFNPVLDRIGKLGAVTDAQPHRQRRDRSGRGRRRPGGQPAQERRPGPGADGPGNATVRRGRAGG